MTLTAPTGAHTSGREDGRRRPRTGRTRVLVVLVVGLVLGALLGAAGDLTGVQGDLEQARGRVEQLREDLTTVEQRDAALIAALRADGLTGVKRAERPVVRLVDTLLDAVDTGNVEGLRTLFTPDAVLTDLGALRVTRGATAIALAYGQLEDPRLQRTSDVVRVDGQVIWTHRHGIFVAQVVRGRFASLVLVPRVAPAR